MKSALVTPATILILMLALACDHNDDEPQFVLKPCDERAVFGIPGNSEYILPFPVGDSYQVIQSYCTPGGSHRNQLAYDFAIPIGVDIVATRSGIVREVREDLPDNGVAPTSSIHNHINIEHDDGSVAFYAHLMQDQVFVDVGDTTEFGKIIARSGNSGSTGGTPHLHFGIYRTWPPVEGDDLPVNFRNCEGILDAQSGLQVGEMYEALPY